MAPGSTAKSLGGRSVGKSMNDELGRLYQELSQTPWVLQRELHRWDKGSKHVRVAMLKAFLTRNRHKTGPQLEKEFGNGASLFLTRISSWLRLNYLLGFAVGIQLEAIAVFVAASSGHRFLTEFLEVGGIITVLEVLQVEERMKEEDKLKALSLLLAIGNSGRHYKELICEHSGVKVVVECLINSKNDSFQEEARILLLNLGRGNPRFQVHVAEMVLSLLSSNNTGAQRTGAQCTRTFMQTLPPGFDYVSSCIPMLKSSDLQVQYEAMELLKNLLKYSYLHEALVSNLLGVLTYEIPREVTEKAMAESKAISEGRPIPADSEARSTLRQYGSACKALGALAVEEEAMCAMVVSHGAIAYIARCLTYGDYEVIQYASSALATLILESPEAEKLLEELITEQLVDSLKDDSLRFYRELEPDVVETIKVRCGQMIAAHEEAEEEAEEEEQAPNESPIAEVQT